MVPWLGREVEAAARFLRVSERVRGKKMNRSMHDGGKRSRSWFSSARHLLGRI